MLLQRDLFLSIIRVGIGNTTSLLKAESVDWNEIEALAAKQGLSGVLVDSIEKLPEDNRPPKLILLQWIGETLQDYEYRYELYLRTIAEMAAFYNKHGYKMMILKGYACSLDWPKPEHRLCGDIDIWLLGDQKEADAVLGKEKGIEIDSSHHHHTVFYWHDFMVENHYDFVNVHAHKSSRELEQIFKELGRDDSHSIELCGEKVYLPSPNLHALFLIRHMVSHFASTELNLRQILDWAFFVKAHGREVDWKWLEGLLEKFHMKDFFNCLDRICVEDLGFNSSMFPNIQCDPNLKERILNDTLSPEFAGEEPDRLIARVIFKYKRWQTNAWKQKICYGESRWSMFWSGVWNHLLKPASI